MPSQCQKIKCEGESSQSKSWSMEAVTLTVLRLKVSGSRNASFSKIKLYVGKFIAFFNTFYFFYKIITLIN